MPEPKLESKPEPEKFFSMTARAAAIRKEVHARVHRVTATRVKSPGELEVPTDTEKQRIFLEKSREVWKQFAVHGIFIVDKFSGKRKLLNRTDLDGGAALGILKMAGFDTSDVLYVKPGESVPGRIMVDTGYQSGLIVEDNGTAFFDHHGKDSNKASISAAKLVYRVLAETGFIERTPVLDALTKFITQVDNQTHPDLKTKEFWENSDKTILGLYRFMTFEKLLQFFQDGHSPSDVLTKEQLIEYSPTIQGQGKGAPPEHKLLKGQEEQRRNINQSKEKVHQLEQDGFVINTKYGRLVVDIGKKLAGGQLVTRAYDYDGYLIYNPDAQSFFVGINHGKFDFTPPQGVIVRDTMWIKPDDGKPLQLVLKDIINVIGAKDAQPSGKLREFVEQIERVYEVTPQSPQPGKTNWTVGGLAKLGLLPRDFKPEPGKKYRVVIAGDSNPDERRGVLLLNVLGLAESAARVDQKPEQRGEIVDINTTPDSLKFDPEANRGQGGWKARITRTRDGRPWTIIGYFSPGTVIDIRRGSIRAEIFNEQRDTCQLKLITE